MQRVDLDALDRVWQEAFAPMRAASATPPLPRTPESIAAERARSEHLLGTDPDGAFVAECDGHVVGFAHALVREQLFVLAMLAVHPAHQDRHLGRQLLESALSYGAGCEMKYVFSSSDPRALHRYVRAGSALRPTLSIGGREPGGKPEPSELRLSGDLTADLELVDRLDRSVRGAARPQDHAFWRRLGDQLVIDERGAYAVLAPGRLVTLVAASEPLARSLLREMLRGYPDGRSLEIGFVVAEQSWAIETAAECGATLRVQGAMMTAGLDRVPSPYLPSGMFA